MRLCRICGETKPLEDFAKQGKYRKHSCKKCHSKRVIQYYKDNPNKWEEYKSRQSNYKRHHVTEERYREMLLKYNGMCWSCMVKTTTVIDHDHDCCSGPYSCGECVRGLLCGSCNTAAGMLYNDAERARLLAQYLSNQTMRAYASG